ncbi:MAG: hypothetical protein HOQ27_13155 [Dermatophilaceae bacterium]|nr:hypothetical protein [Dermatophilaceae bacterium]
MTRELPSAETVDVIRAAVLGVPGVAGLHAGAYGEAATHFPGRSVPGVQVRPEGASVHLVLAWGAPAEATASEVRAVVSRITDRPVDVVIEDVAGPAGPMMGEDSGP